MATIAELADEFWRLLKRHEPYYAVIAGDEPGSIEPLDERSAAAQSAEARDLLARLEQAAVGPAEADLAAVLKALAARTADRHASLWHIHPVAPYQSAGLIEMARVVVAPQPPPERARLTAELVAHVESIARLVAGQRARGIMLPRPAVAAARATWTGLRAQLPAILHDDRLAAACEQVLTEMDTSAGLAGEAVGVANLPGGEAVYRSWVKHETTLDVDPEQLHELGLEQCDVLAAQMAEVRARLGGPKDEEQARDWVKAQPHLYAASPDDVAATYRRHIVQVEPGLTALFKALPEAKYDVRRADPAVEPGMTFGYYQPPTPDEPLGLYRFNGSALATRSQLTAAALILHELVPGHHFHVARQRENTALHPLQQHALGLAAFNEGWAEYGSDLGWELGAYASDWDAYGRLAHERMMAQRLVVDTALNLGRWDLGRARAFMRANTLEEEGQVVSESLRYATDLPGQGLAYRTGYLALKQARQAAAGADVRDVHEAMIGGGAVPLGRMQERVRAVAGRG